jgi:hypothetical protein
MGASSHSPPVQPAQRCCTSSRCDGAHALSWRRHDGPGVPRRNLVAWFLGGSAAASPGLKRATATIRIVFGADADPVSFRSSGSWVQSGRWRAVLRQELVVRTGLIGTKAARTNPAARKALVRADTSVPGADSCSAAKSVSLVPQANRRRLSPTNVSQDRRRRGIGAHLDAGADRARHGRPWTLNARPARP